MAHPEVAPHSVAIVALALVSLAASSPPARAAYPPPIPDRIDLTVRETAGVARAGEVVRSGVPLPRELGVVATDDLVVVDSAGSPVPAQFHVQARWHAPLNSSAPIQWLLVAFPATVAANGSSTYRLVLDGSAGPNPPPAQPIVVTQVGDQVTVDTGAARFVVGGGAGSLFDEIRLANGTRLVDASTMTATRGSVWSHPTTRAAVGFEKLGPLFAVAVVTGAYAMPPAGGGGLGSERRYVFSSGSSTVLVRQSVAWEGNLCGLQPVVCPGGAVNGQLLTSIRDTLRLTLGGSTLALTAVGERSAAAVTGSATAAQSAHLRQRLRSDRTAPLQFEIALPGAAPVTGARADGALFAASGPAGAMALALDHMHRFEPQALRLLPGSTLAIDLADDSAWLANRQGLYASFAVSALPSGPSRAMLDRLVWAPLNRPLRAWPTPSWFAASQAVEELPVGPMPPDLAAYDTVVADALARTLATVDSRGTVGLTTYGLFPRVWNDPINSDEIDCGPPGASNEDPTPADDWDDKFWCATWTDYHNASATATVWAMRSGQVDWLDEIAVPAALRMLYTQMVQCAPGDAFDLCGWAPSGYYGYRWDSNNAHAYLDNLYLYSWLSGDEAILRILPRGARARAGRLCDARGATPPGAVCAPDETDDDPCDDLGGRTASQYYAAFRFLGLFSGDESFLDDWSSNLARHLTLDHAEPAAAGGSVRSLNTQANCNFFDYVTGPGTYVGEQLWHDAIYTYNGLHRWRVDSQNQPLGLPALAPAAVELGWARTLRDMASFGSLSTGDGTGPWPLAYLFEFIGPRLGGTLVGYDWVFYNGDGDGNACEPCDDDGDGDPGTCIYDMCLNPDAKASLSAGMLRAADLTGNAAFRALGASLVQVGLQDALARPLPLSKTTGIRLSRLHAGVARLAASGFIFGDSFATGDTVAWSSSMP